MAASIKKVSYFLISAAITGLIYIGVLYVFTEIWHSKLYVGVAVAYLASMLFYFLINKYFIYKKTVRPHRLYPQVIKFGIMIVVNYLITFFLVWLFWSRTGEIFSGSIAAGIVTTIVAYLVFGKLFK